VPWNLLHGWTERGVTWHLVPYADDDAGTTSVLKLATFALEKQLRDIAASQAKSLAAAADKHGEGSRRYEAAVTRITVRNQRLIEAAEAAAREFGLTVNSQDARNAVLGNQAVAQSKAAIYAGLTDAVKGTMMERAATESDVDPLILADYVEEFKRPVAAEERLAFMGPVSPEETPQAGMGAGQVSSSMEAPTQPVSPPETPTPPQPRGRMVIDNRPRAAQPDRCPRCGAGLTAPKQGRFGLFRGCTRFPACRGLVNCR